MEVFFGVVFSSFTRIRRRSAAALILLFCGLYLLPLGLRPIMRPDEFRYAEIAREMLVTGNWISPRLNGVRYFEKPAPGMALNAAAFRAFGENAFALRFGSALAVLLTAAAVFRFARSNSRDPLMPGVAAAVYLTSGLVYGVGTFAVLDSVLTLFLTLAVMSVYAAWNGAPNARQGWRYRVYASLMLCFAGLFAAGAFLVKGFLALAIPGMTAAAFLVWQKDWKKLFLFPWIPAAALTLTVLPWAVALHAAEPDFWRYFIMEEHINRFLSSTYDRDPQPFWYFVPILLGGCLPAGLVWFAAWRGAVRDAFRRPFIRFLLCWAVLPFLFFSAASCKLGTYILPCFPPLALLTAAALCRALRTRLAETRKILAVLRKSWGILWLAAAAAVPVFLLAAPHVGKLPPPYPDGAGMAWGFAAVSLVYGLLVLRKSPALAPGKRLAILLFGLIGPVVCGLAAIPGPLFGDRMTGIGLAECLRQVPVSPDDVVLTGRSEMAAVAWTLKRADLIVVGKPGELAYGFKNYPGEYAGRHCPDEALRDLIARHRGRVAYITTKRNLRKHPLPPGGGAYAEHCGMAIKRY